MQISIGQKAVSRAQITDKMIRDFATLSGDHNPIHLDDAFAAQSRFGRRIAHGMITACLFSSALAREFPGAIYLGQSLKFTAPVFVDEEIEIELHINAIRTEKRILTIETVARKLNGDVVLKGEAMAMLPETYKF
jgi:3-hydroxybutyryl-CoA dehydratase